MFSIKQISSIKEEENKIKEEKIYQIQFSKNKVYDGLVMCLGTKEACNKYLSLLEQTIDEQTSDQPIKKTKEYKNPSKLECQNCINVKREFSCLNDENTILKQKLKEYENMLISKNKQILSHKNAEEKEKKKSEELMNIYKPEDIEKIVTMSKTVLKIFVPNCTGYSSDSSSSGFSSDGSNLDNVPLVVNYPMVQVHPRFITDLKHYIKMSKPSSYIFRKIAVQVFPADSLTSSTSKVILNKYVDEINAILEFFTINNYDDFNLAMAQSILGQICQEKKRLNKSLNVTISSTKNNPAKENVTVNQNETTTLLNNSSDLSNFSKNITIKHNQNNCESDFEESGDETDSDQEESYAGKVCGTFVKNKKQRLQLSDNDD